MTMSPRLRKFALTAHVICSVGWLGAVVGVLVLAVAGIASQDVQLVRAAYLLMDLVGSFVLIPFALASLLTGLVQALGTKWGLFRHYWVIVKLVITTLATVVLLAYTQTLGYLSGVAADPIWSDADLAVLRSPSVVVHASAALLLLSVATVLAVYKPRGMTRYGRRARQSV